MPDTTRKVLTDALVELGVYSIAETPSAPDMDVALSRLNRLLDSWNGQRAAVYAETFVDLTIVPNQQIHTIGPDGTTTPDWEVSQRPVSIDGASLLLDDVYDPINLRSVDWWRGLTVPSVTSTVVTDLYYEPSWPLGKVYLWPIPTVAYGIRLQLRYVLADLALTDTFSLPPGYRDAIVLTVAEMCARAFGKPVDPSLRLDAAQARGVIFANNDTPPPIQTADAGMPTGGAGPYFNYRNGQLC